MNRDVWNDYKVKETGELLRACRYTKDNMADMLSEFKDNDIVGPENITVPDFMMPGEYACYFVNSDDPYVFIVGGKLFDIRYEEA